MVYESQIKTGEKHKRSLEKNLGSATPHPIYSLKLQITQLELFKITLNIKTNYYKCSPLHERNLRKFHHQIPFKTINDVYESPTSYTLVL